jgi:hypothetical protein
MASSYHSKAGKNKTGQTKSDSIQGRRNKSQTTARENRAYALYPERKGQEEVVDYFLLMSMVVSTTAETERKE